MKQISTPKAPEPKGHYSQAVVGNGFVFVAGQLPLVPNSDSHDVGTIEEQATQVLRNISAILEEAGSGMDKVTKMTIYVSDIIHWEKVNAVYGDFFPNHKPARIVIPASKFHLGYDVMMDAVAVE